MIEAIEIYEDERERERDMRLVFNEAPPSDKIFMRARERIGIEA